jgi:hypothetical protein
MHMSSFHIHIKDPREIIPRLGKGERHWKQGRSAYELSTKWMQAGGIPPAVKAVLQTVPEWRPVELLEGIFERETALPGRGRPSQTDLLAIVRLQAGNAVLAVEGKVDEPFGPLVDDWLAGRADAQAPATGRGSEDGGANRKVRLAGLCKILCVDPGAVGRLHYQLFHRTSAALYEALRFGYGRAAMLVHSFAPAPAAPSTPAGFAEFQAFARVIGMPVASPNTISTAKICEGIEVRLAWVSDQTIAP